MATERVSSALGELADHAHWATIPVINALTDEEQPLGTLEEHPQAMDAYAEENQRIDRIFAELESVTGRQITALTPTSEDETVQVLTTRLFEAIDRAPGGDSPAQGSRATRCSGWICLVTAHSSIGEREAGLHVADIQHHPCQPGQKGKDPRQGGEPRQIAENDLNDTDGLHDIGQLVTIV